MRKQLGLALGLGAAVAAAQTGIAGYFFRRTVIRQNADKERTIKMANTDWGAYIPKIKEKKKWLAGQERREVWINSRDGLRLHANYFPVKDSQKVVLCLHGYTSDGLGDFTSHAKFYLSMGYHVLMPDARAHGKSQGKYIGFGCLDRYDVLRWLDYLESVLVPGCQVVIHGVSMGAATALMAAGLDLPASVRCIVSDCAFTSPWEVFDSVLRERYHLYPRPILEISDQLTRIKAGYSLRECNAKEEVKKARVPILFVHGREDTFVPCRMCREIYDNCASPKEIFLVEGAGHAESYYKETEAYEKRVKAMLEERIGK